MDGYIFLIILFVFVGGVHWYADYKPPKEIESMATMFPKKDLLLEITPPIPYFKAFFIALPFIVLGYYSYCNAPESKSNFIAYSLLILGLLISVLFSFLYFFIRKSKNSLNNYCLDKCKKLRVKFILGNLNSKPIVACAPWSKKDMRKIEFVREIDS